jgi:hypothetical protein
VRQLRSQFISFERRPSPVAEPVAVVALLDSVLL